MNDLYIHQLETENKQLRIALQECRKALEQEIEQLKDLLNKANDEVVSYCNCCIDLQQRIDKAIEFIKSYNSTIKSRNELGIYVDFMSIPKELLEILGEKENE